jgi:5'-3' exonuclease
MGVERFFSSLKRDYNFINPADKKIECEHFFIDFNSIVHVISQFLLEDIKKDKTMTKDIFEKLLIDKVGEYIEDLLKTQFYINNLITINICIDGVPTMSKIYEQKKRRYMGDLLTHINAFPSTFSWSRNQISPGTEFMNNMMNFLKSDIFKERIYRICPNLKHYNVSGIDMFGEGEIKIFHYIQMMSKTKYKNDRYVVYSPDSDVIIILLMANVNVYMLRYDQQLSTANNPIYSIVDINVFKNILYDYILDKVDRKLDKTNVIMDIVFILTVFGDDFLPKLETIRVNTDINLLIDHYIVIILKYGYILSNKNNIYEININNFLELLKLLQKKEDYFLKRNAKYHVSTNYNRIVDNIIGYNMNILRDLIVEYLWKFIYYNKPSNESITPINAHEYISIDILKLFMNNSEPKQNMSKFTKRSFNNLIVWDKMLDIINEYYIEILQSINSKKMKDKNIYPFESYYINSLPNQLLKDIIEYFYLTYELPIIVPLKTSPDKILFATFKSSEHPHINKLNKLLDIDKNMYKINNKLDEYFNILNPQDKFYYDIYFKKNINYSSYYNIHFKHIKINNIVKEYIKGFNWIISYYHNSSSDYNNLDITWYYLYNRSPLLKDIINMFDMSLLNKPLYNIFNTSLKYMTPLEHYIFVSPINIDNDIYNNLKQAIGYISDDKIKYIIQFIKTHPQYYYPLNDIYKNINKEHFIDCSSSIFISKCHLLFMEKYINVIDFIKDFRKYIKP